MVPRVEVREPGEEFVVFAQKVKTVGGAVIVVSTIVSVLFAIVIQTVIQTSVNPLVARFERQTERQGIVDSLQTIALRDMAIEVARISRGQEVLVEASLYPNGSRERLREIRRSRQPQETKP